MTTPSARASTCDWSMGGGVKSIRVGARVGFTVGVAGSGVRGSHVGTTEATGIARAVATGA